VYKEGIASWRKQKNQFFAELVTFRTVSIGFYEAWKDLFFLLRSRKRAMMMKIKERTKGPY
jgi:hypothetical protein